MRKITVAVDEETYKRVRVAAAGRNTSVSVLVEAYLVELASQGAETEPLKRREREIRSRILVFSASDNLSRDDAHRRSKEAQLPLP
jgi:hypothetical protein